jgi:hypothetical protein
MSEYCILSKSNLILKYQKLKIHQYLSLIFKILCYIKKVKKREQLTYIKYII